RTYHIVDVLSDFSLEQKHTNSTTDSGSDPECLCNGLLRRGITRCEWCIDQFLNYALLDASSTGSDKVKSSTSEAREVSKTIRKACESSQPLLSSARIGALWSVRVTACVLSSVPFHQFTSLMEECMQHFF
ncbi:unnamed protein product, partial [Discosporangium mesarthrocarpum]